MEAATRQLTLLLVRQVDAFNDECRRMARTQIRRERNAYYLFESLDEVPDDWPTDKWGDGVSDAYCLPCARRAVKAARTLGVKLPVGRDVEEFDGPYREHCDEGESSRNCYVCGRPLPWALLEYGMESEVEHYTGEFFRRGAIECGVSANDWYWLWRVVDECATCEEYMLEYAPRLAPTWIWLRDNGFFHVKPDTPRAESRTIEQVEANW